MSMTNKTERDEAQRFIDDVIAINKDFGATVTVPEEKYEAAVEEARRAFSWAHTDGAR